MEFRSEKSRTSFLIPSVIFLLPLILVSNDGPPIVPIAHGSVPQLSGAAVFAQKCARCHGSDGRAQTAKGRSVGATDLTSSAWIPDAERDTRIVMRGKESMPGFKSKLKPAEIAAVVSYIRRFKR